MTVVTVCLTYDHIVVTVHAESILVVCTYCANHNHLDTSTAVLYDVDVYGKLFADAFTGSLYGRPSLTFAVWAWIIAHQRPDRSDGRCYAEINPLLLAATFASTPDDILRTLEWLEAEDPASRSQAEGGRRIVLISPARILGPLQYRVVNGHVYREMRDEDERRRYAREAKRRSRAAAKGGSSTSPAETTTAASSSDEVAAMWAHFISQRSSAIPGARALPLTPDRAKALTSLLAAGYSADDVRAVIDHYADRARRDPDQARWMNAATPWRPENFARALGQVGTRDAPRPTEAGWSPASDEYATTGEITGREVDLGEVIDRVWPGGGDR